MNYRGLIVALQFSVVITQPIRSQSVELEYTGELQTAFKDEYNFVNLLWLEGELPVIKDRVTLHASVFSFAKTYDGWLIDDLQGYSSIEIDNLPLAPAVACVDWHVNEHNHLCAGVRSINEDYFVSPVTLLFTNSSCGILPTVASFPVCNYPYTSLGMHYSRETDKLNYQLSFYNGKGYNRFFGDESVFRLNPKEDGVFGMTELEFKNLSSSYYLGGCAHYGNIGDASEKMRGAVWGYALQAVSSKVHLIGVYSHSFPDDVDCVDFVGLGTRMVLGKTEVGLFTDYARFSSDEEYATELTCKYSCGEHCELQPALHYVFNDKVNRLVGLIRVIVTL